MLPSRTGKLSRLYGGVRYTDKLLSIARDEAFRIVNCHIDESGNVYTRKGSRKLTTETVSSPGDGVSEIFEFARYTGDGVVYELLAVIGQTWVFIDTSDGTLTTIAELTTANKPSIVAFVDGSGNQIVVLANGEDFLQYSGEGNTATDMVADFANDFVATYKPKFLAVYDNRLFAGGCLDTPNRVYASGLLNPTSWGGSAYFSYDDGGDGEPVTGIGTMWSYLVVTKRNWVYIDTEGDPESSSLVQILVSSRFGCSSHWSILTVGDAIYFVNERGVCRGVLRSVAADGLEVKVISDEKVKRKFDACTDFSEISGVYDELRDEILWGFKTSGNDTYDFSLVYNRKLSEYDSPYVGRRDIWNGWFEGDGYEPQVFGTMTDSSGKKVVCRGDSAGYVYVQDEADQWKDTNSSGVDKDISSTIQLGLFNSGNEAVTKRFRQFVPSIYQKYNESTTIKWTIHSRFQGFLTAFAFDGTTSEYEGSVPLWNEILEDDRLQVWGGTVWADKPTLPVIIDINEIGGMISFLIYNSGENDEDEISYSGASVVFQTMGVRR